VKTIEEQIATGFDHLAPGYDFLSRMVFGNALRNAQSYFLEQLPRGGRILVMGGGSGWFLEQLLSQTDCPEIVYQDVSAQMLRRSEERIRRVLPNQLPRVRFVQAGILDLPRQKFEVICTHCFLDLFSSESLPGVVNRLSDRLLPKGVWYFSDFHPVDHFPMNGVSRLLLWLMYRFFRSTCRIEAERLPAFDLAWQANGLSAGEEKCFYGGMIRAQLFHQTPSISGGARPFSKARS